MVLARESSVRALDLLQGGVPADIQRGVVVLLSALGRRRRGRPPPERGGEMDSGAGAGTARDQAGTEVDHAGNGRRRWAEGGGGVRRLVWVRGEVKHAGHGTSRWLSVPRGTVELL